MVTESSKPFISTYAKTGCSSELLVPLLTITTTGPLVVIVDNGTRRSSEEHLFSALVLNFMAGKRGHGPVQSLKLHHGPTELEDVMSGQLSNGMNFGQVQRACKNDSSKRRQFNIFQYINIYQ
ncbi:hypothetical protein M513_10165 [Trichuris suis]|uniref:Uncharacterized protein n=1 Tax=Trichuris suis TaxID=68888 RepID=A0A085LVC8_9BILA|nr:hypothetical protein M513_10165 [Trichuris suis]